MYKYLDEIRSPQDIKKFNIEELTVLCEEIRDFLIKSVSSTGGHLSSSLGVVELTVALHYVFDSPKDKLIFDVGHQGYVHKLLTGRKDQFDSLRQYDGLSGFLKRSESEHDIAEAGHSTTSLSIALGMAKSRDLSKEQYDVLPIIGDGSLTGGMAYEAMNMIGHTPIDVKMIFNDNEMSISENVGAIGKSLNKMRTTQKYRNVKRKTKSTMLKVPVMGEPILNAGSKVKSSFKHFVVNGGYFFEEFGFTYMGPVDGHNLNDLINYFEDLKKIQGPAVAHIRTQKGKGYTFSEKNPGLYHGVGKFDYKKGIEPKIKKDYSSVVGHQLIEMADEDDKVVAISAAMISGTGLVDFKKKFPDRCIDVGIAEQNAVTMAAGMALNGYKPYVVIYSTFLQRAYDQIVHDVCMQDLPVTFCIDRAGLVGNDGETHHGVFDLAYLLQIPNMHIIAPRDEVSLKKMLQFSKTFEHPLAIRYPRGNAFKIEDVEVLPLDNGYEPFQCELLRGSGEVTMLAYGKMVSVALEAGNELKKHGIDAKIVDLKSAKPLDEKGILQIVKNDKLVITLEDHQMIGGIGDQLLKVFNHHSEFKLDQTKVINIGYQDEFIPQGDVNKLFEVTGLSSDAIVKKILENI